MYTKCLHCNCQLKNSVYNIYNMRLVITIERLPCYFDNCLVVLKIFWFKPSPIHLTEQIANYQLFRLCFLCYIHSPTFTYFHARETTNYAQN